MSKTDALNKLFGNRMYLEGNVVYSMFKKCELFDDYPLKDNDFKTTEGRFLFNLGKIISNKGIDKIDKTVIDMELSVRPELKSEVEEYGGSIAIIKQMNIVNENNIETYYDELLKSNYLVELHKKGFDVERYADKLVDKSYDDLCEFMEYIFTSNDYNNGRLGKGVKTTLLEFTDDIFDDILNGEMYETVSFGDYCPLLNHEINGLVTGTTTILAAPSNHGKSTYMLSSIIYPIIKQGEEVLLISNEMTYRQYLYMLIPIVLVREFKYFGLTRMKMRDQNFNEDDLAALKKAKDFINTELRHAIKFVEFDSGEIAIVKKSMKLWSKLGVKVAVYDNMKAEKSDDAKAWAKIIENGKELTFHAGDCGMNLLLPYQITQSSEDKHLLSRADLAEGKAICTIVSVLLIFRKVKRDEFDGGKYELKPYKFVKSEATGKWEKQSIPFGKEQMDKKFIVLTIDKNRFGETDKSLLYQFDAQHAVYREIGWCTPAMDYKKG